jgi:hypothetical protein
MCLRFGLGSACVVSMALLLAGCGSEFTPDSGAGDGHCNGPGALSDDFEGSELNDAFQPRIYTTDLTIEASGGMLVFTPPDGGGSGSFDARYAIDLRNAFAVVEVPEPSGGLEGKTIAMTLDQGNAHSVSMSVNEDTSNPGTGLLHFDVRNDASNTKNSTAYDPELHRWWRVGERDGVLSFDASPDGKSWTTYQEVPAPPFVEAGYLNLEMNDGGNVTPIEPVRFDNLNPQGGSFCGVDRLQEPFDADLGERWALSEGTDCTSQVTGGAWEATVPTGGTGQCTIATRPAYDIRDRELTVAFGSLPTSDSGTGVSLTLRSGDDDKLTLQHSQGKLVATTNIGSVTSNGSVDLAGGPSWWRIRQTGARVEFEVSADGKTFDSVHSVIVDSIPPRFVVSLGLWVNAGQSDDTKLVVDSLN